MNRRSERRKSLGCRTSFHMLQVHAVSRPAEIHGRGILLEIGVSGQLGISGAVFDLISADFTAS